MTSLVIELNGKKYLEMSMQIPIERADVWDIAIKSVGGIVRTTRVDTGGFIMRPSAVIGFLIPEENVEAFNNLNM